MLIFSSTLIARGVTSYPDLGVTGATRCKILKTKAVLQVAFLLDFLSYPKGSRATLILVLREPLLENSENKSFLSSCA